MEVFAELLKLLTMYYEKLFDAKNITLYNGQYIEYHVK